VRGDLRIARRARPVSVPAALPSDLQEAIDHSLPGVRAGAIPSLVRMLSVAHEGRVLAARLALRRLAEDDSRMVATAAAKALEERARPGTSGVPAPTSLIASRESGAPAAAKAHAGVPPDREPPRSTVLSGSDTPAKPGTGADRAAGGGQADRPAERSRLTASGAGSATQGLRAARVPDSATRPAATPASLKAAVPRVTAGLALVLLVAGLMAVSGGLLGHLGDTTPNTALFGTVWPWALVAAMFVLTCRDHPWVPGAALGLLAGTTGLLGGSGGNYPWFLLGMAAVIIAVACQTSPVWLAAAGAVLGATGVLLVADSADTLETINGDAGDVAFLVVAVGLLCLAGYRVWRDQAWLSAIAPALLLLDAILTLTGGVPQYVTHASFAGYVTVAAGLLVRANEYVSANEPSFTSVAHVALPLAAAVIAYFSRSR
jgi:hypothetical protein